jgi:hypothetical protein
MCNSENVKRPAPEMGEKSRMACESALNAREVVTY